MKFSGMALSNLSKLIQAKLYVSLHPITFWICGRVFHSLCLNISVALALSNSDNQQVFHVRTSRSNCVSLSKRFPIYLPWGGAHVAVLILSSWTDYTLEPHLWTHRSTPFSLPWCPRSLSSVSEIYYFLHELLRLSLIPMFPFLLHFIWFQTTLTSSDLDC